jgi:hypothetical protein
MNRPHDDSLRTKIIFANYNCVLCLFVCVCGQVREKVRQMMWFDAQLIAPWWVVIPHGMQRRVVATGY